MIDKERALRDRLSSLGSVVVAYSGGVDSAYLALIAHDTLGDRALAVTADSPSYPRRHRQMAIQIAERFGLQHEIIRTDELEQPEYRANPANRCYYCKHELYTHLTRIARGRHAVVVDGNNADDRGDYRPGRQAAREFGVRSPLDEVDLGKHEIRELSRRAGLPTWDEPASACLSSRIPYLHEVTDEKLRMIERAEEALRALGFRVCRVRHHDDLARIEVGRDELPRALEPEVSAAIVAALKEHRLPLRHHRSAGLPHRQLERRAAAAADVHRSHARKRLGCVTPRSWSLAAALALASSRCIFRFLPRRSRISTRSISRSGIRDFDVAEHQPHPPGYPLFILAAKAAAAATGSEVRALERPRCSRRRAVGVRSDQLVSRPRPEARPVNGSPSAVRSSCWPRR